MQSEVLADSIGGPEEAGALLSMLAIDCMLATTSAFDNLSDVVMFPCLSFPVPNALGI